MLIDEHRIAVRFHKHAVRGAAIRLLDVLTLRFESSALELHVELAHIGELP